MNKILTALALFLFVSCNTTSTDNNNNNEPIGEVMYTTIHVEGMTCSGCEKSIQSAVAEMNGVQEVEASHTDSLVAVYYDVEKVSVDEIKQAIESKGYKAGTHNSNKPQSQAKDNV